MENLTGLHIFYKIVICSLFICCFVNSTKTNRQKLDKDYGPYDNQDWMVSASEQNQSNNLNLSSIFFLEPIINEPLVEDTGSPIPAALRKGSKRDIKYEWTEEDKLKILELHNLYRSNVTPPAGNMAFMEWDEELEHLAKLWAETCNFEHGRPPNTGYRGGTYGQNLYKGTDPTGILGVRLWYEEYHDYDFHKQTCGNQSVPSLEKKVCGHYLTMAWFQNTKMGCAVKKCGYSFLTVCHYSPGALRGTQIYDVSKPCSQCQHGALCYNNLCMTKEQCERNPEKCEIAKCNLKCHNCGILNKEECRCDCADGWDTTDCSRPCKDKHERCGIYPGFTNKASCSLYNHAVENVFCRKMCGKCHIFSENVTVNHVCCDGALCTDGYTLDLDRKPCRCSILCPGPECDVLMASGVTIMNGVILLLLSSLVSIFLSKV